MRTRLHSKVAQKFTVVSPKLALAFVGCACGLLTPPALGALSYDESISGDLSNSGLSPTLVSVAEGQNQVFGTTGRGTGGVDRDYFTFTVPTGLQITSIVVLPGTTTGDSLAFIGVQSGNQVTLPPNATEASGLLGWKHYNAANGNILSDLSIPAQGSTGFVPPLGAGTFAFWVQEFSAGTFSYGFDFSLEPAPVVSVPDSGPGLLGCTAIVALIALGQLRMRRMEISGIAR